MTWRMHDTHYEERRCRDVANVELDGEAVKAKRFRLSMTADTTSSLCSGMRDEAADSRRTTARLSFLQQGCGGRERGDATDARGVAIPGRHSFDQHAHRADRPESSSQIAGSDSPSARETGRSGRWVPGRVVGSASATHLFVRIAWQFISNIPDGTYNSCVLICHPRVEAMPVRVKWLVMTDRPNERPLAAECCDVATRLEQLASQVPAAARALFEETAQLLRAHAVRSDAADQTD